jgi:hypothetical protein
VWLVAISLIDGVAHLNREKGREEGKPGREGEDTKHGVD